MQFYANFTEQALDDGLAFSVLLDVVTFKQFAAGKYLCSLVRKTCLKRSNKMDKLSAIMSTNH